MKRVVTSIIILAAIISTSFYTYSKVDKVNSEMNARIDAIMPVLENGGDELVPMVEELAAYWKGEENTLIRFVRHSHVENITTSVAMLPLLAAHGELGSVGAELANIRCQMEHIYESEGLTFTNWL